MTLDDARPTGATLEPMNDAITVPVRSVSLDRVLVEEVRDLLAQARLLQPVVGDLAERAHACMKRADGKLPSDDDGWSAATDASGLHELFATVGRMAAVLAAAVEWEYPEDDLPGWAIPPTR